ncbi:MAG: hypothetical protein ACXVES_00650 [Actinomycetota bacterium]
MPRYLRWIAAMTAGVTAYFAWTILTFGIARARGVTELHGGMAALVGFGAYIVTMLAVLGVNDWLHKRYSQPGVVTEPPPARPDLSDEQQAERVGPTGS